MLPTSETVLPSAAQPPPNVRADRLHLISAQSGRRPVAVVMVSPLISQRDTGQQRQGLILGHSNLNLLDGFSANLCRPRYRCTREAREAWVVHDRHASQLEVSGTAVT